MQDIALWFAMRERRLPAEAADALRQIAALDRGRRVPYLGYIESALNAADAGVRAAGAAALAGTTSYVSFGHLTAALHDDDGSVRAAAVDALRESADGHDPGRFAVALFHPRADVRRRAIDPAAEFPMPKWRALHLLADPECRDRVRELVDDQSVTAAALELLFRFAEADIVNRGELRRWAGFVAWADVLGRFEEPARAAGSVDLADPAATAAADALDDYFTLFVGGEPADAAWLKSLADDLAGRPREVGERVADSLTVAGFRTGAWLAPPAAEDGNTPFGLAALFRPTLLGRTDIPLARRRSAVPLLLEYGERVPGITPAAAAELIDGDFCRRPDGRFDLTAVAAVLLKFESAPFRWLFEHVTAEEFIAGFEADPDSVLPLLKARDPSGTARRAIVRQVCLLPAGRRGSFLAKLAQVVPRDQADFLLAIDGPTACDVFAECRRLDAEGRFRYSPKKCRRLAEWLVRRIAPSHIGMFLGRWLDGPDPEDSELGLTLLGELARLKETHFLDQAIRSLSPEHKRLFARCVNCCAGYPYDRELSLAASWRVDADPELAAWAAARLEPPEGRFDPPQGEERETKLRAGLCAALRAGPDPGGPNLDRCLSLLACHDDLDEVDVQFARFGIDDAEFVTRLDEGMVAFWRGEARLPTAGHAWLYRWDRHREWFLAAAEPGGVVAFLERAAGLRSTPLARRLWQAGAKWLESIDDWHDGLGDVLVAELTGRLAAVAARALRHRHDRRPDDAKLAALRDRVRTALIAAEPSVRDTLRPWIDTRGLPEPPPPPPPPELPFAEEVKEFDVSGPLSDVVARAVAAAAAGTLTEGDAERVHAEIDARGDLAEHVDALAASPHESLAGPAVTLALGRDDEWPFDEAARYALSPQPLLYGRAVRRVLKQGDMDEGRRLALEAFLEAGEGRMADLRDEVALALHNEWRSLHAVPILGRGHDEDDRAHLLAGRPADVVMCLARGFLMLGDDEGEEEHLLDMLDEPRVHRDARQDALGLVMREANDLDNRERARKGFRPSWGRSLKLRRLAGTFAWGVRVGRELTGRLFTIRMLADEKLGYTRFTENKIYVTGLPILRGEPDGRAVVQALILHEYGHHVYHADPDAQEVWKRAAGEKLHPLLNLVSDEHLERNLRATDRAFGDRLKLLASYAFQHANRDVEVDSLLDALGPHALEVLTAVPLSASRAHNSVRAGNGRLMQLMEQAGMSFARFVRALRMGLGDRHGDPKVAAGLALFRGKFRRSDMNRLYDTAVELRKIFGKETEMLDSFSQDAILTACGEECDTAGEGISNDEVQAEVQKVLEGDRPKRDKLDRDGPATKMLNLGAEEEFPPITKVVPLPHDPAAHADYAQKVARPAAKMRSSLADLGVALEPRRMRVRGRSFDRGRAKALVLRGDPRVLIAREAKVKTDLFLGVVVDCSGSMSMHDHMEKAKQFATLLAESAKGHRGIDVRLYGFTDRVIYDAGTADRCAAHALYPDDGNNDAAALLYAAQAAKASRRRAKLLVMISDGSPTECSVTALRGLVERLTRRMKICCAQVAVCPLDHVCFPHYVVLDDADIGESVRRFGRVVAGLVRRAMSAG